MRPLSRTELFVLFCIWMTPPATAVATDSSLLAVGYATDWALAMAILGACLYVTASVTVNVPVLVRRMSAADA